MPAFARARGEECPFSPHRRPRPDDFEGSSKSYLNVPLASLPRLKTGEWRMEMGQTRTDETAGNSLVLPARLDAATVAGVAEGLRAQAGAPLRLDGGEVRHLGGLGLELLLRAERDWRRTGQAFAVLPRSQALNDALADFGIDPARFDPEAA
ncbi:STAS domain-containing protein [Sinirhodobacter populi]|uniref:STAS domain-containing protein n=2 Tax=Paenirhodobacter populi TaxID=2306993 RepID=A0A443JU78_9RHOB|nr:STAS domain-containing protein [Sinirhodobacter populi]